MAKRNGRLLCGTLSYGSTLHVEYVLHRLTSGEAAFWLRTVGKRSFERIDYALIAPGKPEFITVVQAAGPLMVPFQHLVTAYERLPRQIIESKRMTVLDGDAAFRFAVYQHWANVNGTNDQRERAFPGGWSYAMVNGDEPK